MEDVEVEEPARIEATSSREGQGRPMNEPMVVRTQELREDQKQGPG